LIIFILLRPFIFNKLNSSFTTIDLDAFGGKVKSRFREVQDALDSAPLFNPENYLRLAAYGGDHTETKQILTDAMEAQGRVQARIPRAGGLMIPMNSSGF